MTQATTTASNRTVIPGFALTWKNRRLDRVFADHAEAGTLTFAGLVNVRNELVTLWPYIRGERSYGQGMSEAAKVCKKLAPSEDDEREIVGVILAINAAISHRQVPSLMTLSLEDECALLS